MATFQAYQPINMDTLSVLSGDFTDWSGSMLEYTAGSTVMTYFGAFTITDMGLRVVLDQSDGTGAYGTLNGYTAEVSGVLGYAVDGVALHLLDFFSATTFLDSHAMLASGNDSFTGSSGDDLLYGMNGRDTMRGSLGDDVFYGGGGRDSLQGGSGDDTLRGEAGDDFLKGGSGHDTLDGGTGHDGLYGQNGRDRLYGRDGVDHLFGGDKGDKLYGGSGEDILNGGRGKDRLFGGTDGDLLDGSVGNDILVGGGGIDAFEFQLGCDRDTVRDFADDVDVLFFDHRLWDGAELSKRQMIRQFAEVVDGDTVFDFGDGNAVVVRGIDDRTLLFDDVRILDYL